MNSKQLTARTIFQEIGSVRWTNNHSFEVQTPFATKLLLSPNTDPDSGCPTHVIIDEVFVPARFRRRGNATKAIHSLCRLSDTFQFTLEAGLISRSDFSWGNEFLAWVLKFGFIASTPRYKSLADECSVCVRRQPVTQSCMESRVRRSLYSEV